MEKPAPSDPELLADWLGRQREPAFHALVARYAGLVHAAARRTCGDDSMAAEASQLTFIALAQKAKSLTSCASLGGWLHLTALMQAKNLLRKSQRENRKRQLLQAAMETEPSHQSNDAWAEMQPVLDDALAALSDKDREALLLRFYRSLSIREIAATLGIATDAAQKRIDRATERLRGKLARRGVQTGGSLSAAMVAGFAVDAQAAIPVSVIATKAIAAGTVGSFELTTLLTTTALMKSLSLILPLVAIILTAGWIGVRRHSISPAETETPPLRQQVTTSGSFKTLPVPKKKSEITEADFRQRMEEALAKYEITGETDTTEVEELFRLHRELAITAIRQAKMPWLVGELVGKDPGSRENGIRWIEENLKGEEKNLCLIGFAKGVAQSDPKAVLSLAEGMNPGQVRDKMLGIAIVATAKGDVIGATSLYLHYFEDLRRGSLSDLRGWGNAILMEMCRQLPAGEVGAMLDKPVFGKISEIDHRAILMVGDAHPEVAVRFCLRENCDPVLLHEMALRRLYKSDATGMDTVLRSASDRYTREEMISGVVRRLVDYEEDESMRLGNLPLTAYDEEIFTRAASYIDDSYFEQLMDSAISDDRKRYLAKGSKQQKRTR